MVLDYLVHNFDAPNAVVTRSNVRVGAGRLKMVAIGRRTTGGKLEVTIQVREEGKSPISLETGLVWSGASGGELFWAGDIPVTSDYKLRFSVWNDSGASVPMRARYQIE